MDQVCRKRGHELPELPAPRHLFRGWDTQLLPLVRVLDAGLGLRVCFEGGPGKLVQGRIGGCVGLDVVQEGGVAGEVALEDVRGFPAPGLGFLSRQPVHEGQGSVKGNSRLFSFTAPVKFDLSQFLGKFIFSFLTQVIPGCPRTLTVLLTYNHNKVTDRQVLNPINNLEAHSSARDDLIEIHGGHGNVFWMWFLVLGLLLSSRMDLFFPQIHLNVFDATNPFECI